MTSLGAATVLRLGGWDARHTRVMFVAERDDLAIALLGADSDLNLDDFERHADGTWHKGSMSGSADDTGSGMQGQVAYTYGRASAGTAVAVEYQGETHTIVADENGWWAFLARFDPDRPRSLPRKGSWPRPPVISTSWRWRRRVWRWPTAPPPIIAPTRPPVFDESRMATASNPHLANPVERLWVRLPAWMVADGERSEPAAGTSSSD